jgi:hypothetical protein
MASRSNQVVDRAVPERFRWALWALMVAATIYALITVAAVIADVIKLIAWVQPAARVPLVMNVNYPLPTNGGQNSYGGGPFVRDGTALVATQVSTTLDNIPPLNRLALSSAPLIWDVTALLVTALLFTALVRLARGITFGRNAARPVVAAAVVLAVGGSMAQLTLGFASVAFGVFSWAAPAGTDNTITRVNGFTFDFTYLIAACVLIVIALILRRGLALQNDIDGLI